ncbi:MAG TPA: aminotransferase class V-fold PLP-dependent enzyme [Burkholderiaceae bacterium]
MTAVPLFKVHTPAAAHGALKPVLESGRLACGPQVARFEERFAQWMGAGAALAVSDASAALMLALYTLGVRPGDEVLAPALACSATVMPIASLFARPVWYDIDSLTGMPAVHHLAAALTPKTRAILLYHWSGDVAPVAAISDFAKRHDLPLVEDASEALGARLRGAQLGGTADFTVFSFYPTKPLHTGEGAALLSSDPKRLQQASRLRRFGFEPGSLRLPNGDLNPRLDIPLAGFNVPMNEVAATLGLAALDGIGPILAAHRANGAYYETALAGVPGLRLLRRETHAESAYWTYSLLAERRDDLVAKLSAQGIGAQRLHLRNDGYGCFGGVPSELPGTAEFDAANLSIPCGWWVDEAARERVVRCIRDGW